MNKMLSSDFHLTRSTRFNIAETDGVDLKTGGAYSPL